MVSGGTRNNPAHEGPGELCLQDSEPPGQVNRLSRSPACGSPVWADRSGELVRGEIRRPKLTPPVAADPITGYTFQLARGTWINHADRHAISR